MHQTLSPTKEWDVELKIESGGKIIMWYLGRLSWAAILNFCGNGNPDRIRMKNTETGQQFDLLCDPRLLLSEEGRKRHAQTVKSRLAASCRQKKRGAAT